MADTILPTGGETREGLKKVIYFDHDGPNPYPTGGEELTKSMINKLGLTNLDFLSACGGGDNGAHSVVVRFSTKGSQQTAKIIWSTVADGLEVANGANLSSRFVRLRAVGPN